MSKIEKDKLLISSDFYSVQGEGKSTGVPSYFVRLATCNLTCGMSRLFANKLMKEQTLADGEIFKGDLELEGKATWTCDSTSQWLWRGVNQDFQYLIDRWKDQGIYEDILHGNIHIIWTGGEPTIKAHQEAIVVIANDGTLLKAEANPYMMKDRPILAYQDDTVPNRLLGRGTVEKAYNSQKAIDAQVRSHLDSLALTTSPMMAMDATRLPRGAKFYDHLASVKPRRCPLRARRGLPLSRCGSFGSYRKETQAAGVV